MTIDYDNYKKLREKVSLSENPRVATSLLEARTHLDYVYGNLMNAGDEILSKEAKARVEYSLAVLRHESQGWNSMLPRSPPKYSPEVEARLIHAELVLKHESPKIHDFLSGKWL
jgi:hypothetical protein